MMSYLAALLLSAEPASAAIVAPAAQPISLQAAFDAANKAHDAGRAGDAIRLYEMLEQRPGVRRDPTVLGIVRVRKGLDLHIVDRNEEAESVLRAGLKTIEAGRADLRNDLFLSHEALGEIALLQLNYVAAKEEFKRALALADEPIVRSRTLAALAKASTFDAGDEALGYIDQALVVAQALPNRTRKSVANVHTLRARILLNHGRHEEALAELRKVISDQGGLDYTVDISEFIARSDLAIAATLSRRDEEARRYLAFSGAGRMVDAPFRSAVGMVPPPCGGPADLRPDDVAIVEFGIRADGTISYATPIYASINGPAVLEYARAVMDWSWRPKDVEKIPELFRMFTRVELRCSTSAERPAAARYLETELARWLAAKTAPFPISGNAAADLPRLRAELARRQAAGGGPDEIPVLIDIAKNPITPDGDRTALFAKAIDIAGRAGAPRAAMMAIETRLGFTQFDRGRDGREKYRLFLREMLARPGVSDDPRLAGTLTLMVTEPAYRLPAPTDAAPLLLQVANDPRLPAEDPLRVGALVRLAAAQAAAGDLAAATRSYGQTGLGAQQCALLDAKPAVVHTNVSGADYPNEAFKWGFEGWVRTEYDIMADGKTANRRAIIAYPPLVFREAALSIIKGVTYSKSYRPDGAAGCGGEQQNVNFIARR